MGPSAAAQPASAPPTMADWCAMPTPRASRGSSVPSAGEQVVLPAPVAWLMMMGAHTISETRTLKAMVAIFGSRIIRLRAAFTRSAAVNVSRGMVDTTRVWPQDAPPLVLMIALELPAPTTLERATLNLLLSKSVPARMQKVTAQPNGFWESGEGKGMVEDAVPWPAADEDRPPALPSGISASFPVALTGNCSTHPF
eukprot:6197986-Prymnesium_polylepis.1